MPDSDPTNLYSTRELAGQQAAMKSGGWRKRILDALRERPQALFEVASKFGVPDHTISGRFSELARDGYIAHAGERRVHPVSSCAAEVWTIAGDAAAPQPDWAKLLGYPLSLAIAGETFDRQELLPQEGYPGIPYARRADTGGQRLVHRVALVECPRCGKPLVLVGEDPTDKSKKLRCLGTQCMTMYRPRFVQEAGRNPVLALIMEVY